MRSPLPSSSYWPSVLRISPSAWKKAFRKNTKVVFIETADASQHEAMLKPGTTWRNRPLQPHQLICIEAGTIIEVSTPDSVEDNYRVLPGDSQKTV